MRELSLWSRAGVQPVGDWYDESGQGMGATLLIADQLRAYTLTDVATFLNHRYPLDLAMLVEGDSLLVNPYHVIRANPDRFPRANVEGAVALADYLLDPAIQGAIGEFRRAELGRSIFVPDGTGR